MVQKSDSDICSQHVSCRICALSEHYDLKRILKSSFVSVDLTKSECYLCVRLLAAHQIGQSRAVAVFCGLGLNLEYRHSASFMGKPVWDLKVCNVNIMSKEFENAHTAKRSPFTNLFNDHVFWSSETLQVWSLRLFVSSIMSTVMTFANCHQCKAFTKVEYSKTLSQIHFDIFALKCLHDGPLRTHFLQLRKSVSCPLFKMQHVLRLHCILVH